MNIEPEEIRAAHRRALTSARRMAAQWDNDGEPSTTELRARREAIIAEMETVAAAPSVEWLSGLYQLPDTRDTPDWN